MRETTIRSQILALMTPGEWVTLDTIRMSGRWTAKVHKDMGGHLGGLAYDRRVEVRRVLVTDVAKGGRRVRLEYRLPPVDHIPAMAEPPAPVVHRPLVTDLAAWALANPPRGVSAAVPSLAKTSLQMHGQDTPMRRRA
jgi:hypothetical protein